MEHRYTEGGITYEYISNYDILVITKSGETRKDYEVQDLIENRCVYKTPVTVITHDIDFINKMLTEGQYFFTDIEKEGILLYDAGNTPLAERKPLSSTEAKGVAEKYLEQWYYSGVNFLNMSLYAKGVNNLKEAAFVLHQATERTYNAIDGEYKDGQDIVLDAVNNTIGACPYSITGAVFKLFIAVLIVYG